MRRFLWLALLFLASTAGGRAQEATPQRLIRYFGAWYSYLPGSRVTAAPTREVVVTGLEAYRIERHSASTTHQETNVALYDRGRDEVFVGDVFHDPQRAAGERPFDAAKDLPNVEASLSEAFGLPVRVAVRGSPHGSLQPLAVSIAQRQGALVTRGGFVSPDGATLMLGEFHSLSESPQAFRRRLLAAGPAVAPPAAGAFTVVEFVDFQCERCRKRAPEVRRAIAARGGAVEIRFLPLAKMHDWAFAAAECAAALASSGPQLLNRYEEELFTRQEKMTAAAARELAADLTEAAGVKTKYETELSSGRAQEHVVSDITLAIRLGISGTPSFLEGGTFISGERELLETYLAEKFPAPVRQGSPGAHP